MNFNTLRLFGENGFKTIAPEKFPDAADFCKERALNSLDVRFSVLADCFRISYGVWTEGEGGAATAEDSNLLEQAWILQLPSIVDATEVEEGVALASHLLDDLRAIAASRRNF